LNHQDFFAFEDDPFTGGMNTELQKVLFYAT
jgi:hypothetical protein